MTKEQQIEKKQRLKPLGPVIQICQRCGKVDAFQGDQHDCDPRRREWEEMDDDL